MSVFFFDDIQKTYNVTFSDGKEDTLTTQQLFEFHFFSGADINEEFAEILKQLDSEQTVEIFYNTFDWAFACLVRKSVICKKNKSELTPDFILTSIQCRHMNKYINEAGGKKFWFCRDCKSDLGDA